MTVALQSEERAADQVLLMWAEVLASARIRTSGAGASAELQVL